MALCCTGRDFFENMMKILPLILFVSFSLSCVADQRGPCGADAQKLCPKSKFGKGKVFECLVAKKSELSSKCSKHIEGSLAYKEACQKEIDESCQGQSFFCLLYASKARSKYSSKCLTKVIERATYRKYCILEIEKYCKKVKNKPAELVACLKNNKKQLTGICNADIRR